MSHIYDSSVYTDDTAMYTQNKLELLNTMHIYSIFNHIVHTSDHLRHLRPS